MAERGVGEAVTRRWSYTRWAEEIIRAFSRGRSCELIGRREARAVLRGSEHPVPVGALRILIPGAITNPLNGAHGHWTKKARWSGGQRARAQTLMLDARWRDGWLVRPEWPKRIIFRAYVHNLFDSDGLQAAIKPIRDALKDMWIVDDDRPSAGHDFRYEQEISRGKAAQRGVEIIVQAVGADDYNDNLEGGAL